MRDSSSPAVSGFSSVVQGRNIFRPGLIWHKTCVLFVMSIMSQIAIGLNDSSPRRRLLISTLCCFIKLPDDLCCDPERVLLSIRGDWGIFAGIKFNSQLSPAVRSSFRTGSNYPSSGIGKLLHRDICEDEWLKSSRSSQEEFKSRRRFTRVLREHEVGFGRPSISLDENCTLLFTSEKTVQYPLAQLRVRDTQLRNYSEFAALRAARSFLANFAIAPSGLLYSCSSIFLALFPLINLRPTRRSSVGKLVRSVITPEWEMWMALTVFV